MNSCRYSVHQCVSSIVFETAILLSVLANAVVLVLVIERPDMAVLWDLSLLGFVVVFTIELILKLVGFGCWGTAEVSGDS